jgi:hypothetical protein
MDFAIKQVKYLQKNYQTHTFLNTFNFLSTNSIPSQF